MSDCLTMRLFGKKTKGYLGIDFGAGGIKVVQLTSADNRGVLFTYGFSEREPNEMGTEYLEDVEASGALLKLICTKAKITTKEAVAALPIPSVFSAVLSLAPVPPKELPQAVKWEAKKLIPLPIEEVTLDFKELKFEEEAHHREKGSKEKQQRATQEAKPEKSIAVLLTAAPKGIIERYIAIAKVANLTLTSLETEAFALIRAMIGTDPSPVVIVDIGAVRSNILFVDRGIPMLTRSVQIGGKKCTEAIATSLGIDLGQAEAMKRDLSISGALGTIAPTISAVLKEVLEPLFNEIKYSVNVYRSRNTYARPSEKIILTGGGAGLPGLSELLTAEFNLRTFLGNPWERVNFHQDLTPVVATFSSRFAVAIGLALRNI